ncbi:MAG: serine acetyltransferase [Oscillospiraceae bacterium]|nr:serine acetyltransferase [Oscillospiraceae bacterium]
MNTNDFISGATTKLLEGHRTFIKQEKLNAYPSKEKIIEILRKIEMAVFPGFFDKVAGAMAQDIWLSHLLEDIRIKLTQEIKTAMIRQEDNTSAELTACKVAAKLIEQLADIQKLLQKDAQAGFAGDPAALSIDEIVLTYPGFYAVFVHRIAHFLFTENVPIIPRMMSEHAHSKTGIDVHPGAKIGEYFFIDHGTGVVIGETTTIGNNVKIYQGVTLGALSTRSGQKLAGTKRHPTIGDNVTIYAGTTILGGETIIASDITIGGNQFITKSILK